MPTRERGTLMTAWLVLMLAANAVTLLMYLVFISFPVGHLLLSGIPEWAIYVFILGAALNLVFVCFLFLWKKWGFFGLCASAAAALIVNLYVGAGVFAFVGLFGAVTLYLVLRPKWKFLDNY